MRTLTSENEMFVEKCKQLEKNLMREIRSEKQKGQKLSLETNAVKTEISQLKAELTSTQQKQQQAEVSADKMTHANALAEKKCTEKEEALQELRSLQSTLESRNSELQMTITRLEEQYKHAQASKEQNEKTINELREEHRLAMEKVQTEWKSKLQTEVAGTSEQLAAAKVQVAELTGEMRALSSGRSQTDSQLSTLRNELKSSQSEKESVSHKLETSLAEVQQMRQQVESLNQKLDDKGNELSMALKSFSEMQSSTHERTNQLVEDKARLERKCEEAKTQGDDSTRLAERLQREVEDAQKQLQTLGQENSSATEALSKLKEMEKLASSQMQEVEGKLTVEVQMRERLELREAEQRKEHTAVCAQLLAVQAANQKEKMEYERGLQEKEASLKVEREAMAQEKLLEEQKCRELKEGKVLLESEMRTMKEASEKHQGQTEQLEKLCSISGEADVLRTRLVSLEKQRSEEKDANEQRVKDLEEQVQKGEVTRRKMHNQIQELRGNVRVFVRARPFLPSDGIEEDQKDLTTVEPKADGSSLQLVTYGGKEGEDPTKVSKKEAFTFDKVFAPVSGQETVFEEVSEFVQSALDGFNVCLFSYGQTGSGKTHTMQGSGTGQMRGIIPRSMEKVFDYATHLKGQGWEYTMEVSFLEIYNEDIRDLLGKKKSGDEKSDEKHQIKRDATGEMIITGLTRVGVNIGDSDKVEKIMELASRKRSVSATNMNAQSSRSHSVFVLYLTAENAEQQTKLRGTLNLVDLAGSERLSRSKASGDRLKETQAINKSLSCLTDVFVAIGNKSSHVPFRNSKLTYLLQPALSGDGKTLMMVNISPTPASYFETLCSLRFARQVNQCELGKPKKNLAGMEKSGKGKRTAESTTATSRGSKVRKTTK